MPIQMQAHLEELLEVVDRYEDIKNYRFHPMTGRDRCVACFEKFNDGSPIGLDLGINPYYNWGSRISWSRAAMHVICRPMGVIEPYGVTILHGRNKQHHLAVSRSSRVLLLLEELGLPRDVAWLIAGVACWLL